MENERDTQQEKADEIISFINERETKYVNIEDFREHMQNHLQAHAIDCEFQNINNSEYVPLTNLSEYTAESYKDMLGALNDKEVANLVDKEIQNKAVEVEVDVEKVKEDSESVTKQERADEIIAFIDERGGQYDSLNNFENDIQEEVREFDNDYDHDDDEYEPTSSLTDADADVMRDILESLQDPEIANLVSNVIQEKAAAVHAEKIQEDAKNVTAAVMIEKIVSGRGDDDLKSDLLDAAKADPGLLTIERAGEFENLAQSQIHDEVVQAAFENNSDLRNEVLQTIRDHCEMVIERDGEIQFDNQIAQIEREYMGTDAQREDTEMLLAGLSETARENVINEHFGGDVQKWQEGIDAAKLEHDDANSAASIAYENAKTSSVFDPQPAAAMNQPTPDHGNEPAPGQDHGNEPTPDHGNDLEPTGAVNEPTPEHGHGNEPVPVKDLESGLQPTPYHGHSNEPVPGQDHGTEPTPDHGNDLEPTGAVNEPTPDHGHGTEPTPDHGHGNETAPDHGNDLEPAAAYEYER